MQASIFLFSLANCFKLDYLIDVGVLLFSSRRIHCFPSKKTKMGSQTVSIPHRDLSHRMVCWGILLSFLYSVLPIPLPKYPHAFTGESRYPCEQGTCGCRSALQCWTNCCCYTPEQRKSWADKHRVVPPEFAVLVSTTPRQPLHGSCCESKKSAGLNTSPLNTSPLNKSQTVKSCCKPSTAKLVKKGRSTPLSMLASRCRGGSTLFTSVPWCHPALLPVSSPIFLSGSPHDLGPDLLWIGQTIEPDSPPPKA